MNDPLSMWNDGAVKQRIVSFVEGASTEGSDGYVSPVERIAVFDNDGTLWVEQPVYVQLLFLMQQFGFALEELAVVMSGGSAEIHAKSLPDPLTVEKHAELAAKWLKSSIHPSLGRRFVDCIYAPMRQLLDYLRANDFKVFIISGGGLEFMRVFVEEAYGVPRENTMGSHATMIYAHLDGVPSLVQKQEVGFVDDKAGKPVGLHHRIGRRPILAFGNSDGDFEMLEYTTAGAGPRLGLMLHHDDAEREFAYDRESHVGQLVRGLDEADARGWSIVSMKYDFKKVFA